MSGDPLGRRARHWTRWRRNRLTAAWRTRAHADPLRDEARAAWLCSWQRSGSTLLAEVLASAPRTRLLYEPANLPGALFTGEAAAAVPLPGAPGPELEAIERALRGRVHGAWVDQLARGHLFSRRVVKDVRAMALLPTVAARHPTTAVVVLVRHPLAVARSVVELGWTSDGDREELVLAEVRRWIASHSASLRAPVAVRAHVVAYEHLVHEPDSVLDAVVAHLASYHATWRGLRIDRTRVSRPSATSFRRADAGDWVGTFEDVPARVIDAVAASLDQAGLGRLYGRGPEPLVGPDEVGVAARGG